MAVNNDIFLMFIDAKLTAIHYSIYAVDIAYQMLLISVN